MTQDSRGRGAGWFTGLVLLAGLAGLGWLIAQRLGEVGSAGGGPRGGGSGPVAVEVMPIEVGTIVSRRTFHGSLRARAEIAVAAKISGRIERVHVDVGDRIGRGGLVAELDDAELHQAVLEAEADVKVAQARLAQAETGLRIAERELNRVKALESRGVASDSEFEARQSDVDARQAAVLVGRAEVEREQALLGTAQIRREYTRVHASWAGSDEERIVGERYIEDGDNIVAHQPIISVLDIATIVALVTVTEADYGRLEIGQVATLSTDAFPGKTFEAHIVRKAPLFRTESRQADIELHADNADGALKPGMFVRATVELGREENAVIVSELSLATRGNQRGVFMVNASSDSVSWHPVEIGIAEEGRVQLLGSELTGLVVTLGQQLLSDGSPITVPQTDGTLPAGGAPE